jgi:hypothetical protein
MLVAYSFATNQYEKQLWLLLGVGPALLGIAERHHAAALAGRRLRAVGDQRASNGDARTFAPPV